MLVLFLVFFPSIETPEGKRFEEIEGLFQHVMLGVEEMLTASSGLPGKTRFGLLGCVLGMNF